jgi:GNAT superfamily N-acetyltransferase
MMAAVRVATEADVPALVRLINLAYRVEDFFLHGDRTQASEIRSLLTDDCFLVVDGAPSSDGAPAELAGAVYIAIDGDRGYFGMLAVNPARQGTGLGRALVTAAEDHCRRRGCRWLDLSVVDLRTELPPFYYKLGYKEFGVSPFPEPARLTRPAQLIRMTKVL